MAKFDKIVDSISSMTEKINWGTVSTDSDVTLKTDKSTNNTILLFGGFVLILIWFVSKIIKK